MVSTRQSSNIGSGSSSGRAVESTESGLTRKYQSYQGQGSSAQSSAVSTPVQKCNLLDLPFELLEKITTHLDFNTVANLRLVCHQINTVCALRLSSTFQRLQAQMLSRFQAIKAQMPRRESARRNHPLACECDIIETLHMRLTLLQMSFGKHIERKHCCFFPGEILDEVYRILHYIKVTPKLTKPYKVADELFDLTTMAMEYFKERIEPTLPEISYFGPDFLDLAGTFLTTNNANKSYGCLESTPMSSDISKASGSGEESTPQNSIDDSCLMDTHVSIPQSNLIMRRRLRKIKQGMKRYDCQLSLVRRDLRSCKSKIADQQKQIMEYVNRLDDSVKKNEENSRKFSTLLQELNKCKTELQYWRSKSPAIPVCNGCGQTVPMPVENFEAFANQDNISNELETVDFIPIEDKDTSNDNLSRSISITSPSTQLDSVQSSTQQSDMAISKGPGPASVTKRKLSEVSLSNDPIKKTRRNSKSRQVKHVKI